MKRPSSSVSFEVRWTTFNRTWSVPLSVLTVPYPKMRETIKSLRLKKRHRGLFSLYKSDQEDRDSTSKKRLVCTSQVLRGIPRQNSKPLAEHTEQDKLNQCM